MGQLISIREYATYEVIADILCRERAKMVRKSKGGTKDFVHSGKADAQLVSMMPPRRLWLSPYKSRRDLGGDSNIASWTRDRKIAAERLRMTIRSRRCPKGSTEPWPWAAELDRFIAHIQALLGSESPLVLETPQITAKFKEQDGADFIYRPICSYSDLTTKVLVTLAYEYIVRTFDSVIHSGMYFMRGPQSWRDENGAIRWHTKNYMDCIRRASAYRKAHDSQDIWVGECDIQKFYDILNHDKIEECFEVLYGHRLMKEKGTPKDMSVFDPLRRIVHAYLKSFSFTGDILGKNSDQAFWAGEKALHRSRECPDPVCRFNWVKDEDFLKHGAYATPDELQEAKTTGKIGIPQGGALSGIIVNVVMNVVDRDIVGSSDPERFFVRYCDDILLMHTDRQMCEEYLDTYRRALTEQKLIYHPFRNVADVKKDGKLTADYYHCKSKEVYLWGRDRHVEDSSDWVPFVGYEMRGTGEIRVRKDKVDAQFRKIKRQYFILSKDKDPRPMEEVMEKFSNVARAMDDYTLVNPSRYTENQARRLDKYVGVQARKLAKQRGETILPKDVTCYQDVMGEKDEQ